jgi:Fe-Mn family superoxide dismutase
VNRREAIRTITIGSIASLVAGGGPSMAQQPSPPASGSDTSGPSRVPPGRHAMKPLPFDARKLRGLSERLLVSHHENNYGGALKNLNKVEEDLARLTGETPGFIVSGLKERELTFTNSVILHELYFGNLGGDGRADGRIRRDLGETHGAFARWEELFRATGLSLAGGSGWAILDFNFHTGDLRTYWSGNHTQALASGCPLLVMDMYEHAYHIDYGAAAARYVEAFFQNINWAEVHRRYERARTAAKALNPGG